MKFSIIIFKIIVFPNFGLKYASKLTLSTAADVNKCAGAANTGNLSN